MSQVKSWSKLLISIVGCEIVGISGTLFTITAIPNWYAYLNKPIFSPPNWIFGPVWTVLYALMGISFYLIWKQGWKKQITKNAALYFFIQLGLNFLWTPIFFGLKSLLLALIVIIAMWIFIVLTMKKMYPISKVASFLLIPYLLWVTFATTLNASILFLN